MIKNEVIEEIWQIKDDLAREADYDLDKFCDQLAEYTQRNPRPRHTPRTPEEVLHFLDFGTFAGASVHDDEAGYGEKKSDGDTSSR
ncbi:MAG: hypothetical protein ABI579_04950 [Candidatus Sumerlaeota bacterium]